MPALSVKGPLADIRPEAELLLCCARTRMDPARAGRVKALLQKDIDWTYLLRTARAHGMMPLLYWHLNATCPEAVPKTTLDQLRDHFHANARRNLFLTRELLGLLEMFEAYGISAVPFKGPVLTVALYGNLALRQFSDLDILIHKQDVTRAKTLLISQGYRADLHLTGVQETAYIHSHYDYDFHRQDGEFFLEIHWAVVPRYFSFALDSEHLWQHLEPLSLGGKEVLTLSPEDLFLSLCVHGAKHCWERLGWICDIAELIRVFQGINWGRIMEQANILGCERMLFLGLFLASDLLGTVLPEEVWQKVQSDPKVKSLAAQVRAQLFQDASGPPGILANSLFHLRARERLGDRVRYCLGFAMTPTAGDLALLPLPAALFPLYYLLRPIRLAGKYGLKLMRQICISKCRGPIHRIRTRA